MLCQVTIANTVVRTCGHTSVHCSSASLLAAPIESASTTLRDCLSCYFDGRYESGAASQCVDCNEKVGIETTSSGAEIICSSDHLLVQLKRLSYSVAQQRVIKSEKQIDVPQR